MKLKLLSFLLLALPCLVNAQHIYFSDTSNFWGRKTTISLGSTNMVTSYSSFETDNTPVEWQGNTYRRIYYRNGSDTSTSALVREDTANHRVYMKANSKTFWQILSNATDTVHEFLYMDYNLAVGDTLCLPIVSQYSDDTVTLLQVSQIDSVQVNSEWYRRFAMKHTGSGESMVYYDFIEGLGPTYGPFSAGRDYDIVVIRLVCFKNNGVSPFTFYANCDIPNSIGSVKLPEGFSLFPNPADDYLVIRQNSVPSGNFTYRLSAFTGTVIQEAAFKTEAQLDLRTFPSGIYLLKLYQDRQFLGVQKIIVRH